MSNQELPYSAGAHFVGQWPYASKAYSDLICDSRRDSYYLRREGLKPNLLRFVGDCRDKRVLDAGSGDGWFLDELRPSEGYACDVADQPEMDARWHFTVQDVRCMSYQNEFFDVVVASLLLMWFDEIERACAEIYRITKHSGKLVISLVHPYFYRTGELNEAGDLLLARDLSKPFKFESLKIGGVAGPLTYFYHPFPHYLNSCIQAGFRLHSLFDWFIDMDDYREQMTHGMRSALPRTGKVPLYSFIECVKD